MMNQANTQRLAQPLQSVSRVRGFTLIELMIVVSIVGILAAIAMPTYQEYIYRAKAAEVILVMDKIKTVLADVDATQGSIGDQRVISWAPNSRTLESCLKPSSSGGSLGSSQKCEPVSGISAADLDLQGLGITMYVTSGGRGTEKAGQYKITLGWRQNRPDSRQIALAAYHLMQPYTYDPGVGQSAIWTYGGGGTARPSRTVSLYFTLR